MKLFMGVLLATLALNGVLSLPARTEDAEVIGGPRRILSRARDDDAADDDDDFTNFKGVIDTGSGYPFLQPNPSVIRVGFFDSFDDLFRRFSQRLFPTDLLSRAGSDSDEEDEPRLTSAIDPKKANSTSTVKVVDGHKVEVNETVYGDDNSIFKLRVVNIRPLEEGETVEETEHKDIKPVTQGPQEANNAESNESDEKREPLDKKALENEIQGNIDGPEHHSIAKKENIVETTEPTTIKTTIDTTMLPTAEDINAVFVTDNGLEQEEYSTAAASEEELNGASGNGNNEFETNMSEENNSNSPNNNNNNNNDDNDFDDNIDSVENVEVEHTIENNENTEEELDDNLNESSSSSKYDVTDNEQENNDKEADIEIVNLKKKNSKYPAKIGNREREGESSSDDEDANANADEMHAAFNKEWDYLDKPTNEKNDFNNAIDGYYNLPIDLSNDIAVNYAPNLPINPDAEYIDVNLLQHSANSAPQFEKLSLNYQPASEEEWRNAPAK